MFSEKVVVALITLSMAASAALGAAVVKDYADRGNNKVVAVAGGSSSDTGAVADQSTADQGQAPAGTQTGTSVGGGTSKTTVSGGAASKTVHQSNLATSQAASGVSGDKIVVGGIFDMTGPVDASVERDTVRAYFNIVNNQGGIGGRKLVYLDCDGQYDNVQTHNCSNELVASKVLAVVGMTAPKGENDEIGFLTKGQGIPSVGGLGTPNEYVYPLSFPVSPSFAFSGNGLAAQFKQNQANGGFKHPAILYIDDVPWVQPVLKAIIDALAKVGVTPTHVEPAHATDGDYTSHVAALKFSSDYQGGTCAAPTDTDSGACADTLIAATDPFSYARLFQAMDRAPWHPPVVAGGLDKGNQQHAYGDQLNKAQSLTPFLTPYDPVNAGNATINNYYAAVKKYYPNQFEALDVYTQIAWTAAQVFVDAAKRADANNNHNLTRATLVDALNSTTNFDTGWSTPISYAPGNSHDPNHCYYFVKHDPKTFDDGGTWRQYTPLECF